MDAPALWELFKVVITAGAGYGGVWYGQRRSAQADAKKVEQELVYLATIVSSHLERFLMECVKLAWDDGVDRYGRDSNGGYFIPQTPTPEFDPSKMGVNWHVLPRELMYEVLSIPARQAGIEAYLSSFEDGPGDDDMITERGYQYAVLGQQATKIAADLRATAGIPSEVLTKGNWSRDESFQQTVDSYITRKAARDERHSINMAKFPLPPT